MSFLPRIQKNLPSNVTSNINTRLKYEDAQNEAIRTQRVSNFG